MTAWAELLVALAVFVGSHFLPSRPAVKTPLIAWLGKSGYGIAYSLVSIAVLAWMIAAAERAPFLELWPQYGWMRWAPNVAMPLSFVLICAGIGLRWRWTLGAGRKAFDPLDPGFAAVTRHPLLLALILWSGSHLIANGDLAHVVLFGTFLGLSLAAIPLFDARARATIPIEDQTRVFAATALFSLRPFKSGVWLRQNTGLLPRLVLGLILSAVLITLHQPVIGVSPRPF